MKLFRLKDGNYTNQKFNGRTLPLVAVALACFAFPQNAQAVVPPPDGGYPGSNTAEGQGALLSLTSGTLNTAIGASSLRDVTDGGLNTGVGGATLYFNTANENTATGAGALFLNTTGSANTANGAFALLSNTTGSANTAIGDRALLSNTEGEANVATGWSALYSNTTGVGNTANGYRALDQNTTGNGNTANGLNALFSNTTGFDNTAVGAGALSDNITGSRNTAIGSGALLGGQYLGDQNTAIGNNALGSLDFGIGTTAVGADAMSNSITSEGNTAIGVRALQNTRTFGPFGINNTGVGADTLVNNTLGYSNIALGYLAGNNVTDAANVICIGAAGENVGNTCYIANIYGQVSSRGTAVFVNSDGKLGTLSSSRRFKEDIKSMDTTSEALFSLEPVIFRYKQDIDPDRRRQFGLVAEDVEKVNPDLVVRDKDGKPYSVRYEQVNAMLLNEFLKEHRKNEEQQATIAQLKKEMETVAARLKEDDSRIQAVSARIEVSKAVEQTALNNP